MSAGEKDYCATYTELTLTKSQVRVSTLSGLRFHPDTQGQYRIESRTESAIIYDETGKEAGHGHPTGLWGFIGYCSDNTEPVLRFKTFCEQLK